MFISICLMTSATCILILLASGAILSTAQKPVQKVCPSNCSLVRCAGIAPSVCNEKYNGVSVEGDGCCNCCRVCYVSAGLKGLGSTGYRDEEGILEGMNRHHLGGFGATKDWKLDPETTISVAKVEANLAQHKISEYPSYARLV
uniref:Uncharacterized protein n=1 Tax=Timema monikensis TaxID=170555 RepID=A0A7R9EKL8_9NEOP|nr:unnamed protein product [Timema monikensis]